MQASDVARTQGEINAEKALKDPAKLAEAREQLGAEGRPVTDASVAQRAYDNAQAEYGTGSSVQQAIQAVMGALTALAGNNLAGALAGGASPYLATEIKKLTGDNTAANAMAHAVLGAVTAELNNQSALAGGVSAGGGELAAREIMKTLYPGKKAPELTESEKQQVSALSQLAAGLAGGLAAGNTEGAVTGSQAGKNAVENNFLLSLLAPPPPVAGQTTPQTEANAAITRKLDAAVKEFGEQQVKQCLSGGECPMAAQVAIMALKATMTQEENGPSHTGNNEGQVNTGASHTGNNDGQVNAGPNHTGNNDDLVNTGPNHTGNNQGATDAGPNHTGSAEGAPDLPNHMESQGYEPNKGSVGNMGEFFKQPGFGMDIKESSTKTSKQYQGQSVYKANQPVGDYIQKGDQFYLDARHKNHIEVFDRTGTQVRAVLNLDGSYNDAKTKAARAEGRRLSK